MGKARLEAFSDGVIAIHACYPSILPSIDTDTV